MNFRRQWSNLVPKHSVGPMITVLAFVLLVVHTLSFGFVIDDAYISFRYAQNLIDGHGLVFNPGEAVEGYSNLLWVLLCALGMKVGAAPLLWSRILGGLSGLVTLQLLPGIVGRLAPNATIRNPWPGRFAQLVFAAVGAAACWMFSGLETPLFLLWMTAAWRAALRRSPVPAGLFGLLLILTRPEGPAPAVIFLAWSLLPRSAEDRDRPAGMWGRWLGPALLVLGTAAFFLWRKSTFGYWLPNTYYAKTGDLAGQLKTGLPYAGDFLLRLGWPLLLAVLAAAVRTGAGLLRSREMLLTMGVIAFWTTYVIVVGGDTLGMFRFFVPVTTLLVGWTAAWLASAGWLRGAGRTLILGALLAAALLPGSKYGREPWLARTHMREANLGGWMLAGDAMARQLPAGSTIALGPAGYIPWKTGFHAWEYFGIVTPHIAHRDMSFDSGFAGHQKHDGDWIVAQRPDYLLIGNVDITPQPRRGLIPPLEVEKEIVLNKEFQANYEMMSLRLANGKYLNLFRRRADTR